MRPNKDERRDRAARLLKLYPDDEETALVDLLADSLHWCSREGVSFSQALGLAVMHFAAESIVGDSGENEVEANEQT